MPNTNFQTFHQMGQAINEVVRQATGRDAVQNIDMNHVTVAQNQYYEEVSVSGSMVSFTDRVGNTPLEKCVVQIEPVQDLHGYSRPWVGGAGKNLFDASLLKDQALWNNISLKVKPDTIYTMSTDKPSNALYLYFNNTNTAGGSSSDTVYSGHPVTVTSTSDGYVYVSQRRASGDDSFQNYNYQIEEGSTATDYTPYSNICPITGWTGAHIYVSPTTDAQDGTTYAITFPAGAGTVYGGTLDVTTGLLTVDSRMTVLDGDEAWQISSYNLNVQFVQNSDEFPDIAVAKYENVVCSHIKMINSVPTADLPLGNACFNGQRTAWLINMGFTSLSALKSYLATSPMTVVYPLVTPLTYQLTPTEIRTLLGQNYIWADTGDIEVEYKVLKELY